MPPSGAFRRALRRCAAVHRRCASSRARFAVRGLRRRSGCRLQRGPLSARPSLPAPRAPPAARAMAESLVHRLATCVTSLDVGVPALVQARRLPIGIATRLPPAAGARADAACACAPGVAAPRRLHGGRAAEPEQRSRLQSAAHGVPRPLCRRAPAHARGRHAACAVLQHQGAAPAPPRQAMRARETLPAPALVVCRRTLISATAGARLDARAGALPRGRRAHGRRRATQRRCAPARNHVSAPAMHRPKAPSSLLLLRACSLVSAMPLPCIGTA
jgi:hypothetical protein